MRDLLVLSIFDQAELITMLAEVEERDPGELLDDLTHDVPQPPEP